MARLKDSQDKRKTPTLRLVLQFVKKAPVGAIIDRPWILLSQNPSPQGENKAISLRKIRKTAFFSGRSMIAPTSSKENMVSRQSERPTLRLVLVEISGIELLLFVCLKDSQDERKTPTFRLVLVEISGADRCCLFA